MKTNNATKTLCSLLSMCKPDIEDLAAHSKGNVKYFQAQYRNIAVMFAQGEAPEICSQPLPSNTGSFIAKPVDNNTLHGINIYQTTLQNPFTTVDGFVSADGLPTLVETRISNNVERYFSNYPQKIGVLKTLFPRGFGWVLMLPLDYVSEEAEPLPKFESFGGQVAIMPYTSSEMQAEIKKYAPHGSDTRVLVR